MRPRSRQESSTTSNLEPVVCMYTPMVYTQLYAFGEIAVETVIVDNVPRQRALRSQFAKCVLARVSQIWKKLCRSCHACSIGVIDVELYAWLCVDPICAIIVAEPVVHWHIF